MTGWRVAVALALVAAYAVASHLLMTHASNHPWTVAALFGPLLAAAAMSLSSVSVIANALRLRQAKI